MADEADTTRVSPSDMDLPQDEKASNNATSGESDRDNETPDTVNDTDIDSASQNTPEVSDGLMNDDSMSEHELNGTPNDRSEDSKFEASDSQNDAFDLIEENVSSIRKSVTQTHEQLATARNLIYICASIAGVVMVASIVFYVVMTGQIAQKTTELDRVLMAVAKRGIQLGNGIEKLSKVETDLLALNSHNQQIVIQLKTLEASVQEVRNSLQDNTENASIDHDELMSAVDQVTTSQIEVQEEYFLSISNTLKSFESLNALPAGHTAISGTIDRLSSRVESMGTRLDDLYMLEKSQIKDIMRSLGHQPNPESEPDADAQGD